MPAARKHVSKIDQCIQTLKEQTCRTMSEMREVDSRLVYKNCNDNSNDESDTESNDKDELGIELVFTP